MSRARRWCGTVCPAGQPVRLLEGRDGPAGVPARLVGVAECVERGDQVGVAGGERPPLPLDDVLEHRDGRGRSPGLREGVGQLAGEDQGVAGGPDPRAAFAAPTVSSYNLTAGSALPAQV